MTTVTIRDRQYAMSKASVMVLSPLLSAMGVTEDESGKLAAMQESDREQYGRQLLQRLSEPTRHYQIAFTLARLFPTVPDEILSYRVWNEGDRRYEDFTLDLEVEELAGMIQSAIAAFAVTEPSTNTQLTPEPSPRPKPQGLAPEIPPSKPKAHPVAIRPEALPVTNTVPVKPAAPTLTAEDVRVLKDLAEEAIAELQKVDDYSPVFKTFGVSESLFNYLKAQQ